MTPIKTIQFARGLAAVVLLLTAAVTAQAGSISLSPTVTTVAGGYRYNYNISNTLAEEVLVVDIATPVGGLITDLVAPTGFATAYDSGLGLVSFLEDTAMFSGTGLGGFAFTSSFAPGVTSFTATVLQGDGSLTTISGPLTGPSGVPEPGTFVLVGLAPAAFWFIRRRQ